MKLLLGCVGSWMLTAGLFWLVGRWDAVLPFPGSDLFVVGWVIAWLRGRVRDLYTRYSGALQPPAEVGLGVAWVVMWGATAWVLFAAWRTPPL